jgi:hypothetical protein
LNNKEKQHILKVKNMPCGVCGEGTVSDAHHILDCGRRISHYMVIPLCKECHRTVPNGPSWKMFKVTELDVLAKVIERLK